MPYLIDLRRRTLDLHEPGIRLIDEITGEHVASVLPDKRGFYDHAEQERRTLNLQAESP